MAVTAVTITSGPTVVGRSVTISGTLNRDGGGTNNTLNFYAFNRTYTAGQGLINLATGNQFLNVSGSAGTNIPWSYTGTVPEGDYREVTIDNPEFPYQPQPYYTRSATEIGLVELRRPLPGIWTPQRDSRGLFTERFLQAPGYKDNFGSNNYNRRIYHYATPDGQIYWSAVNNIARLGEYGNLSKAAPTPYGTAIDVPYGWEWPVSTRGGTSTPGGYSTSTITYVSLFYLHNSSKYHDPAAASKYAALFGESRTVANDGVGAYWSNANGEQAIKFGVNATNQVLQNISINGVGNGLHCLVIVQCVDARTNGHKVFLDGQLVGQGTFTFGYIGAYSIRPYYFWGSLSKSDLDIGSVLFQGAIEKFYASDEQAVAISKNPYSYFFCDAPKTSAKRRLFGGVLSLPDAPTEFTSTKAGRVQPRVLTQQPQGAVQIDWSHPLARGIRFAQIGDTPVDIANNILKESNDSNPSVFDLTGRGTNYTGYSDIYYSFRNNDKKPTTAFSILSIVKPISNLPANTTRNIFVNFEDSIAVWGLRFYVSSFTTNGFSLVALNSGGFSYGVSGAVGNNYQFTKPFIVSGSAGTTQSSKIYLNGTLSASGNTLDSPLRAGSTSSRYLSLGPVAGATYLNIIWNRTLTDSEHLQLAQNPWQLFKPAAGRLYFLPATTTQFKGGRFLPQRWKSQPQGTGQLNWNNPITKGLVWASAPTVNSNFELVSNKPILFTNSSGGEVPNSLQNSFSGRTFAHGQSLPNNTLPITSAFTMAVVGELNKQTPNNFTTFLQLFPSFSNTELRLFNNNANGFNIIGFTTNSSGTFISTRTSVTTSSMFGRKFISVSTPAVVNQSLDLYVNNIISNSITSGLWNGTSTSTFSEQAFYGQVLLPYFAQTALIWNRRLSDGDRFLMSENPWQLFAPNPGRIYFLPGATRRGKFLFLFS